MSKFAWYQNWSYSSIFDQPIWTCTEVRLINFVPTIQSNSNNLNQIFDLILQLKNPCGSNPLSLQFWSGIEIGFNFCLKPGSLTDNREVHYWWPPDQTPKAWTGIDLCGRCTMSRWEEYWDETGSHQCLWKKPKILF